MFSIGDKVRIVKTFRASEGQHDGRVGVLVEIDDPEDSRRWKVRFDDGDYEWAHEVELVDSVTIPASVFDGTEIPFASLREVFAVLNKHGVKLDWTK